MEIESALGELELKIERLKVLYEQYFMGIEKAEPLVPRKDVVRLFALLQQEQFRNTALRFRQATLVHRWNTYTARWTKILRAIELGTYSRHVARAQRKGVKVPLEVAVRLPGFHVNEAIAAAHAADSAPAVAVASDRGRPATGGRSEPAAPAARESFAVEETTQVTSLPQALQEGGAERTIELPRRVALSSAATPRPGTAPPPAASPRPGAVPPPAASPRPGSLPPASPRPGSLPPASPRPGSLVPPASAASRPPPPPAARPPTVATSRPTPISIPGAAAPIARPPAGATAPIARPPAGAAAPIARPPASPAGRPPPVPAAATAARPAPAAAPSQPPTPPAASSPTIPGMSDGELRDLHRRFVAARGGAGMRYDAFVSTLSQRVPDILKQRQASEVCFDVEVRDGKAIVKGRPKR